MYSLQCDVYRKMAVSVDIESQCQQTALSCAINLSISKGGLLLCKSSFFFAGTKVEMSCAEWILLILKIANCCLLKISSIFSEDGDTLNTVYCGNVALPYLVELSKIK